MGELWQQITHVVDKPCFKNDFYLDMLENHLN